MSETFTIAQAATPYARGRGQKSELRKKIEELQVGQVLEFRFTENTVTAAQVHSAAKYAKQGSTCVFPVRKVDGGFNIYRTA